MTPDLPTVDPRAISDEERAGDPSPLSVHGGFASGDADRADAARLPTPQECTLLLVDDEEANLDLLEGLLASDGYASLVRTGDPRRVVPLVEACAPDLVLLDLHMPHLSGFEVLADLRRRTPPDDYLPVLVLTADATPEARDRALGEGARDFLTKPFDAVEVLLRVRNLLETRLLHRAQRAARHAAEAAAARSALLAEASRVLGASFDTATALSQLARLLVPRLADGCAVDLVEDGAWRRAASHADPTAADLPTDIPLADAMAAGAGVLVTPMLAGGTAVGALTLLRGALRPGFTADERELAEELARRAALAVENARLFGEATRATEAREWMLSVVAHDLRNPLAAIGMSAEMAAHLLPPRAGAALRENLDAIQATAHRMYRLVDDLLDVSRVQRGGLALRLEEVETDDLFAEAAAMLHPLAAARGLRLEWEGCTGLPAMRADGGRLTQVLSNLVGNAVKFTPEGGRVTVAARSDGGELRVSVADTGPGIPAEHLPHLFGAFWQAASADRRGVGLGLSIARAVVEAHGGRIWVESRVGEGTTFHFTVPHAPSVGESAEGETVVVV